MANEMSEPHSCRQNFKEETEVLLNNQITLELYASHTYLSIAAHYDRFDVALKGFHDFYLEQSGEEREHAMKLIKYINMRGGKVILSKIDEPPPSEQYANPLDALKFTMLLEKRVNKSLLDLHKVASTHADAQLCDFLEAELLKEQVESMKKIANMITNVHRCGPGLGTYIFDRDLKS